MLLTSHAETLNLFFSLTRQHKIVFKNYLRMCGKYWLNAELPILILGPGPGAFLTLYQFFFYTGSRHLGSGMLKVRSGMLKVGSGIIITDPQPWLNVIGLQKAFRPRDLISLSLPDMIMLLLISDYYPLLRNNNCGLECVVHSFAYVVHFLLLRDVWFELGELP